MAKALEKVVDSLKGLADDTKLEIHSQAELTRCASRFRRREPILGGSRARAFPRGGKAFPSATRKFPLRHFRRGAPRARRRVARARASRIDPSTDPFRPSFDAGRGFCSARPRSSARLPPAQGCSPAATDPPRAPVTSVCVVLAPRFDAARLTPSGTPLAPHQETIRDETGGALERGQGERRGTRPRASQARPRSTPGARRDDDFPGGARSRRPISLRGATLARRPRPRSRPRAFFLREETRRGEANRGGGGGVRCEGVGDD